LPTICVMWAMWLCIHMTLVTDGSIRSHLKLFSPQMRWLITLYVWMVSERAHLKIAEVFLDLN